MNRLPECFGIIPARYHSTRFPGKPLAEIHGKPMLWHVYQRAKACRSLARVILATDDNRILEEAEKHSIPVILTADNHLSGTDRVLEAATLLEIPDTAVVVNIQGDEPLLKPDMLDQLIQPFTSSEIHVTTLAKKIDRSEAENPDRVKVVMGKKGDALYFSRAMIPFPRQGRRPDFWGHIGLYAFRMDILKRFNRLDPGNLEHLESLEQLRLLESGVSIRVVKTEHFSVGVDTPRDLDIVARLMKTNKTKKTVNRDQNDTIHVRDRSKPRRRRLE